jgi:hypothetical protein
MPEKLTRGPRIGYDLTMVGAGGSRGANRKKTMEPAPWAQANTWPMAGATVDFDFANNRGFVRGHGQGGVLDAITLTRASNATYVGQDGLLVEAANNQPRLDWNKNYFPLIRNRLRNTEDYTAATWNLKTGINISGKLLTVDTSTGNHRFGLDLNNTLGPTIDPQAYYTVSLEVKSNGVDRVGINADIFIQSIFDLTNQTITNPGAYTNVSIALLDDGYSRIQLTVRTTRVVLYIALLNSSNQNSYTGDGTSGLFVRNIQIEQSDQATEYQAKGDILPTPCELKLEADSRPGLLTEGTRVNRLLHCRDLTQAAWVKTNATVAKDQTGVDGVANAASSLTATDSNATCRQSITLASGVRAISVFVRKVSGTGVVEISINGNDYVRSTLADGDWYRLCAAATVTNPVLEIRLPNNGDVVAVDFAQLEDGVYVTSPILTTTAAATRAEDVAQLSQQYFDTAINKNKMTIGADFSTHLNNQLVVRFRPHGFAWMVGCVGGGGFGLAGPNDPFGAVLPSVFSGAGSVGGGTTRIVNQQWLPSGINVRQISSIRQNDISYQANGNPTIQGPIYNFNQDLNWYPMQSMFIGPANQRIFRIWCVPDFLVAPLGQTA